MAKRLSAHAPQPRSRITFPGYPTLAAASLYLCLSGGCSSDPGSSDPNNITRSTTKTGGTTSTGGKTATTDTTSIGGHLAGFAPSPYDDYPPPVDDQPTPTPDAGVPVPPPATPDADVADTMDPPSPENDAGLAPAITDPTGGGGAPAPY